MRNSLLLGLAGLMLASCGSSQGPSNDIGTPAYTSGQVLENIESASVNEAAPAGVPTANEFEPVNASASFSPDDWLGRWQGVEGTYLVVSRGKDPDSYRLEMQYTLDDKGVFEGIGAGERISFTRPDGVYVLRAASGDATGLKYLAGKKDCLKVKDGEGYCRD